MRVNNVLFEDSPTSEKIFSYFNRRLGQYLAPIGLLKVLSIHSAGSNYPRLPLMHEARSREFKTQTTLMAMKFFSEDMYLYISGEKTIHGMKKEYGEVWNGKALIVNDGNLLFSSLGRRTRERWLSAISVLLTEKKYEYTDNIQSFKILGKISLLFNLATPSYQWHKGELTRTTLYNRLFVVHAWLNKIENRHCKDNFNKTKNLEISLEKFRDHYNRTIRNLNEYKSDIRKLAEDYSALSVRSPFECEDIVTAIVSENAGINHRNFVCEDDILFAKMLKPYNKDPLMPEEPTVIECLRQGRSYPDICRLLNKPPSYKSTISYYRKKALESGALDKDE